ncbi:alpha/beta hydrolase [Arcanobacterium pinnipediorum]|uniref:Alpha/beta hydrolase n=1 Tax=Arcanobacterium pinnipediorum TaxID=1503041 RepID=A0ABY5AK81_9ACTO|nr:alpha/beta hydrolase [Arcanobacterium pinnipediorum]USR80265.1 alpha/beta hydrolase [Arcanobacterium pinnipediorum]
MYSGLIPTFGPRVPDYLGPNWVARTAFLNDVDAGTPPGRPDVAVLVSEVDADTRVAHSGVAALWLPGFLDSFFHVEQAQAWAEAGIPLYGLDFRRSGRSLRVPSRRDDLRDLLIREEEIHAALTHIRAQGAEKIVLIGHSTGGLQAVLFADRHPGAVDAVILNSPWLDHNGPTWQRTAATSVFEKIARVAPLTPIARLKPAYARSLHVDYGGEFYFNPQHKPLTSATVFAGFFTAARRGHAMVARGLDIKEPVLLAHSDKSGSRTHPSEYELAHTDVVLDVEDMKRLAPALGSHVETVEIIGGRHDLALSETPARNRYTRETIRWALRQVGR